MSSTGQNFFLRNLAYTSLLLNQQFSKPINIKYQCLLLVSVLIFASCSTKPTGLRGSRQYSKSGVWKQSNPRINKYVNVYSKNKHVKTCLERATSSRYLYYIHRVFYQYKLPPELAHLPILESCFDSKADSGHARGMWQFTKATATDYGLEVDWLSDDRLNWRKSTHSAARYLKILGDKFDNNWELALAGYNGGPNYMARQIKSQGTRNFWKLNLRKETHEYVPKFLAMLKVARKRYPELYYQGSPRAWARSG
jgi:hypothetical protein